MTDFPTQPDELDVAWLAAVSGIESLTAFTAEKMTGGFWSNMVRLHLTHSQADGPATLVAKFAKTTDQARFICSTFRLNQSELSFYQSAATTSPVRLPQCYLAQTSDDFTQYALLMEDLGTNQIDQLAGCTATDAEAVINALAGLHSHWWEHPDLTTMKWLCTPAQMAQSLTLVMSMVSEQAFANLKDCPTVIAESWPRIMNALPLLLNRLDEHPVTLAHGDVRLPNLFLNTDRAGFIDWQAARRAHGCYDLAYFITQSLTTDIRREHETRLIQYYQQQLAAHGTDAPTMDEIQYAYKLCALYCMVYPIIAASSAHATGSPEALMIAERAFGAVLDLGALELVL